MQERMGSLQVLLSCFSISSLGGLAALLRSGKPLDWRSVLSATLYSGCVGLTIGLVWFQYFNEQGNIEFLIGVSGLAGIGGTTVLDFCVQAMSRGGINIHVTTDGKPGDQTEDSDDARKK